MKLVKAERLSDAVTLYEGDCLDVLPTLTGIDAVVTDPPYGIDYGKLMKGKGDGKGGLDKNRWKDYGRFQWDESRPSSLIFNMIMQISKYQIVWGGNYFSDVLPVSMKWLVWDKCQSFSLADFELAWTNQNKAGRIFRYSRPEALQDGRVHPTQKPVSLMRWCIRQLPDDAQVILDPFAGSGTTGVAAAIEGRKCILIEKDPKYCDIIRRRIADAEANGPQSLFRNVKHPDLFAESSQGEICV